MLRPFFAKTYRQHFWEFFIFGFVFVALFLFWLVVGAGPVIVYLTGGLAGLCFTAAWFFLFLDHRASNPVEVVEVTVMEPIEPIVVEVEPEEGKLAEEIAEAIIEEEIEEELEEAIIEEEIEEEEEEDVTLVKEQSEVKEEPNPVDEHQEAVAYDQPILRFQNIDISKLPEVEAYCVKCHQKRPMHNPHLVEMKNGHPAMRAVCPVCNTGMFRIINLKQEHEWLPEQEWSPEQEQQKQS